MSTATTTPTRLLICQAIGKKRLLMFGYGDFVRVVEPRLFGINSAGHEMLSAYARTRIKYRELPQNSSGAVTRSAPPTLPPSSVSGFTNSML